MAPEMPQEIWWLVCHDLKRQVDFKSLFNCALVSKSWALHALPLLYSIHDDSSTSDDTGTTIYGKYRWAGMWRSIILSSIGVTAYPYCLWLKSLHLGDLESLLRDIASDAKLRPRFFEGPMKEFEINSKTTKTRAGKPILEWQRIVENVGGSITKYAKDAAEKENKTLQLTSLEGANLPTSMLSVWTSRLPTLTTLSIRDGSVLTGEIAQSLRDHCPGFKELTCYNIKGPTVDENMAAFFRTLRSNSLESFSVLSSNDIGYEALEGLMQHSSTLRTLNLSSLQNTSLPFLHLLSSCRYLESFVIEADAISLPSTWAADDRDPLVEVSSWLKECRLLRKIGIKNLGGASKLLSEILKSPDLRLRELEARLVDDDEAFYSALGNQSDLESLILRSNAEVSDTNGARHDSFMDSICQCHKLKDLDIMQQVGGIDPVQLTPKDLAQIKDSLPSLESLSFDGELLTDDYWVPLAQIKCLTTLNINGLSIFTLDGIKSFIRAIMSAGTHTGFRLYIMNQQSDFKITPAQEAELSALMVQIPGGSFEFNYWRDPSEDDMSDLSD